MPREQAGSGNAGGADDRGPRQETGQLDDWQRIETEKPQRDRAMKAWEATHDPSPEFERAGRTPDPEIKQARPERIEPGDLTAEQRAELEEMTGHSIEHILERRNHARAQETDAEPERPAMEPRADLPDDDVYNQVIGAYNRGDLTYRDTLARLDILDASPVHSNKPVDKHAPSLDKNETTYSEQSVLSEQNEPGEPSDAASVRNLLQRLDWRQNKDSTPLEGNDRVDRTIDELNPRFAPGQSAYAENCTGVVQAYELRRRGQDAQPGALEKHLRSDEGGPGGRSLDVIEAPWDRSFTPATKTEIEGAFQDPGSRGVVYIKWNRRGAHVFNVENVEGTVRFVDGQPNPGVTDASHYFGVGHSTMYLRLDDRPTPAANKTAKYLER